LTSIDSEEVPHIRETASEVFEQACCPLLTIDAYLIFVGPNPLYPSKADDFDSAEVAHVGGVLKPKKTNKPEPKPWWVDMKFFKGLSFGDGAQYADAAKRCLRDQAMEKPIPPGKPK